MNEWRFIYRCRHCRLFASPDKYKVAAHQREGCKVRKAKWS